MLYVEVALNYRVGFLTVCVDWTVYININLLTILVQMMAV